MLCTKRSRTANARLPHKMTAPPGRTPTAAAVSRRAQKVGHPDRGAGAVARLRQPPAPVAQPRCRSGDSRRAGQDPRDALGSPSPTGVPRPGSALRRKWPLVARVRASGPHERTAPTRRQRHSPRAMSRSRSGVVPLIAKQAALLNVHHTDDRDRDDRRRSAAVRHATTVDRPPTAGERQSQST